MCIIPCVLLWLYYHMSRKCCPYRTQTSKVEGHTQIDVVRHYYLYFCLKWFDKGRPSHGLGLNNLIIKCGLNLIHSSQDRHTSITVLCRVKQDTVPFIHHLQHSFFQRKFLKTGINKKSRSVTLSSLSSLVRFYILDWRLSSPEGQKIMYLAHTQRKREKGNLLNTSKVRTRLYYL